MQLGTPLAAGRFEVIDGDTVRRGGRVYCERERTLGAAATGRPIELVGAGGHVLTQMEGFHRAPYCLSLHSRR